MSVSHRVGNTGTVFRRTVVNEDLAAQDVSLATNLRMYFTKPNGELLVKTAVFNTTGVDGVIKYTIQAGDFDVPGEWKLQGRVTLPSGEWGSEIETFLVKSNTYRSQ